MTDTKKFVPLLKSDEAGYVTACLLIPDVPDLQGDVCDEATIEEAAFDFLISSRRGFYQHRQALDDVQLVESWVLKSETTLGETRLPRGSWCVTWKVENRELRDLIANGKIRGLSIGGSAERIPLEG